MLCVFSWFHLIWLCHLYIAGLANIKLLTLTCQNFIVYELCLLQWDSVVTTFMRARAEVLEDYFRVKSYNESGRYNVFRAIKSAYLSSWICSQLKYTSLPRCLHIYSVHSLTVIVSSVPKWKEKRRDPHLRRYDALSIYITSIHSLY
jgi:hypothetical protein